LRLIIAGALSRFEPPWYRLGTGGAH